MALQDLQFTILYVDNLEREKEFYQDVLGIVPAFESQGWIQFNTNGASLVLHPKTDGQSPAMQGGASTHVGFRVDNLDAEYRRLNEKDVKFLAAPATAFFGKHATFVDPEGNEIDLLEWSEAPFVPISSESIVNDIVYAHPETMEVLEEHGIRICGGCLVLLNSPVHQTADYSGLGAEEASELVEELNDKLAELNHRAAETEGAASQ